MQDSAAIIRNLETDQDEECNDFEVNDFQSCSNVRICLNLSQHKGIITGKTVIFSGHVFWRVPQLLPYVGLSICNITLLFIINIAT